MNENSNRRNYIRYKSENHQTAIELFYFVEEDKVRITVLVDDESHEGLGCVYVGNLIEPGTMLYWQEAVGLLTRFEVVHCRQLEQSVYRIGLKRLTV